MSVSEEIPDTYPLEEYHQKICEVKYVKAILIAAGLGMRLNPLTDNRPKCMLDVGGKTILQRVLETLRSCGINDIAIVRGYQKEMINFPRIKYYYNDDYMNNNILGSLFYAEEEMDGILVVSYSDILYEEKVLKKLLGSEADISVVVDTKWTEAYEGRTEHPVSEAEKVLVQDNRVVRIGKEPIGAKEAYGEFIGLAKFSGRGTELLKEVYHQVKIEFAGKLFQHEGRVFEKAYLTDMFQELIDRGYTVTNVDIEGGWREIDTVQDYERVGDEWK